MKNTRFSWKLFPAVQGWEETSAAGQSCFAFKCCPCAGIWTPVPKQCPSWPFHGPFVQRPTPTRVGKPNSIHLHCSCKLQVAPMANVFGEKFIGTPCAVAFVSIPRPQRVMCVLCVCFVGGEAEWNRWRCPVYPCLFVCESRFVCVVAPAVSSSAHVLQPLRMLPL